VIRTRALGLRHPDGPVLAFPDLDLPQGGRLVLQGRSGSGKSSWIAIAAGLRAADQGDIVVADQDLGLLGPAERDRWRGANVGLLPQRLHLSDALTVERNLALAFHAVGRPVDAGAIRSALQALDVAELAQRRPAQLSVGQAQRVALARAVLMAPRLLLADEPTASLDDAAADSALALLAGVADACGATLVVATHDRRVTEAWPEAERLELRSPVR
jgi:putative ABC transport system ATP-binding protein